MSEISCEEVLAEIELYVDGELDPDRATHLADHLRGCSPCMERAEFQARLKELVRRKCHADPPAHLVVRIRSIIRRDRFDRA